MDRIICCARDPSMGAQHKKSSAFGGPFLIFPVFPEASFWDPLKIKKPRWRGAALCDPDRIQTCNLLIRSQMLYSVKLRDLLRVQIYKFFLFPFGTKSLFRADYLLLPYKLPV